MNYVDLFLNTKEDITTRVCLASGIQLPSSNTSIQLLKQVSIQKMVTQKIEILAQENAVLLQHSKNVTVGHDKPLRIQMIINTLHRSTSLTSI